MLIVVGSPVPSALGRLRFVLLRRAAASSFTRVLGYNHRIRTPRYLRRDFLRALSPICTPCGLVRQIWRGNDLISVSSMLVGSMDNDLNRGEFYVQNCPTEWRVYQ